MCRPANFGNYCSRVGITVMDRNEINNYISENNT